jgi:hypothetical protein
MKELLMHYGIQAEHGLIGALFGAINILIRPTKNSAWMYIIEFGLSVIVATFIGLVTVQMGFNNGLAMLLVACSALLARDILNFVVGIGDYVDDHKEALYKKLFNKLIGKGGEDGGEV